MYFSQIKEELLNIGKKLFKYDTLEIDGDIDLNGKFDFITSEISGAASLSPTEYMQKENLDYNKTEQGRDYFNTFLTLAIQCGAYIGHQQKNKEIDQLKRSLESSEKINVIYETENTKLKGNQMGSGTLEDEIKKLREDNKALSLQNYNLSVYKTAFDKMNTTIEFNNRELS